MNSVDIGSAALLLEWFLLGVKVAAVVFVVVLIIIWRGATFARKRAYGPGGGRR